MSDDSLRPIIIKKKKAGHHGHHGGAWKIAYADFVTAMMAFFLLMWLLGSTTKAERRGIAEYFEQPLKIALLGGEGSGDATSLIEGGGLDLSSNEGQENHSEVDDNPNKTIGDPEPGTPPNCEAEVRSQAQVVAEQLEAASLEDLKAELQTLIEDSPALSVFKDQILLDITREGLRIQIVDAQNRPMFASGSKQMQPYTRDILHSIGKVLNDVPNSVSLSGHTDARAYVGGALGYTNWELSADRANSSRRELIAGGMDANKILRVIGLGAAAPFHPDDPLDAVNRRISIIVMRKQAEAEIRTMGQLKLDAAGTLSADVPGEELGPVHEAATAAAAHAGDERAAQHAPAAKAAH
jgi:chemotaxis protein MotB